MLKSIKKPNDIRSVEALVNALRGNARRIADLGLCEVMHQNADAAGDLNCYAGEILRTADRIEKMALPPKQPSTSVTGIGFLMVEDERR